MTFFCWTKNHNIESAEKYFVRRFGTEPARIFTKHGLLWMGPVPGQDQPDMVTEVAAGELVNVTNVTDQAPAGIDESQPAFQQLEMTLS